MRSLMLWVAYDGTDFVGWQVQPNGPSIQSELEKAWKKLTSEEIRITGSGRTDSGVHAMGQVASVQTETKLDLFRILRGLNALLPAQISVSNVGLVDGSFHAIADAEGKTYRYDIQFGKASSPFSVNKAWFVPRDLDVEEMKRAAKELIGEKDFASFQAAGSPRNSTIRNVQNLSIRDWSEGGFDRVQIEISANGFLYNMVRNIVGTLVEVGKGRWKAEDVQQIVLAKNRKSSGPTAPACGLMLWEVFYPKVQILEKAIG